MVNIFMMFAIVVLFKKRTVKEFGNPLTLNGSYKLII
jgi:hypothetical protein